MKLLRSIAEVDEAGCASSVLVPTMGALHEGHLSLVEAGKRLGLPVTVSIFVNPSQFGPNEDFSRYPRPFERDEELLRNAGVSFLFAPSVDEIYPRQTTTVSVAEVTELYEGERRPGHFDGVTTVVCKLFQIIQPSTAIFGLKDLQQCVVLRRMVEDLNMKVHLRFEPTLRDADGLAKSSRNAYLTLEERRIAPRLYESLKDSAQRIRSSEQPSDVVPLATERLRAAGFDVDYYDLIEIEKFRPTHDISRNCAIIAAVRLKSARLIDNVLLFDDQNMS